MTSKLNLSPSILHAQLTKEAVQALAFDDSDPAKWQKKLRRKVKLLIGKLPDKKCPLNVRSLWKQERGSGTIEKIVFTSEPGSDVPAYLCLPKGEAPPYTFMICVQGHSTGMHNSIAVERDENFKAIEVSGDRDFALGCLDRGIAALCIEQRGFGERREQTQKQVSSHGCHDATMHALMLGRTLLGERVYDVDRSIDYLLTRDDCDKKRIGIMGNSGGGTVSLFSAALLDRLSFAMPSCYFCTFAASIMSIYHCACNYVPDLLNYAEMSDIMGLFAPKPVVIVAGRDDEIFPISATRKAFKELKNIYSHFDAAENCKLIVGKGGHRFYAADAWPTMLKLLNKNNLV